MGKSTRREFLRNMAVTGAALTGLSNAASAASTALKGPGGKSRVVVFTDPKVLKEESEIVQGVLDAMVDSTVARLTGRPKGTEAWKALFSPDDVVGIKVNCLFGKGVSTHPEVTQSVIRGVKLAGVPENNIIVWDRSSGDLIKVGYAPTGEVDGVKVLADDGEWGESIEKGAFKGRISNILDKRITALVNVPILKTHGMTGISLSLKNHYGSFDNPGSHHGNHCNPAIADFNSLPAVVDKTRLIVVDALMPQYEGGPGLKPEEISNYCGVLAGTDPLAVDYQGVQIISKMRKDKGLGAFSEAQLAWLQSAQERGVGTCDPKKIDLLELHA